MEEEPVDISKIASRVSGKCISHLTAPENGQLAIHFVDGSALLIEPLRLAFSLPLSSRSEPHFEKGALEEHGDRGVIGRLRRLHTGCDLNKADPRVDGFQFGNLLAVPVDEIPGS